MTPMEISMKLKPLTLGVLLTFASVVQAADQPFYNPDNKASTSGKTVG